MVSSIGFVVLSSFSATVVRFMVQYTIIVTHAKTDDKLSGRTHSTQSLNVLLYFLGRSIRSAIPSIHSLSIRHD